jgi:hypothetical protein
MLDPNDLENEAEQLAVRLRNARCCDALLPCYRCSLLRYNVLARRRVVAVPLPDRRPVTKPAMGPIAMAARARDLEMRAS